jgi:hypothetical protein
MSDFLLVQLAEHFGRGLKRGELAIGVEDVELAVVLAEGRAGVGAAGVVDGLGVALAFADDQRLQDAEQLVAIGGEVLQNIDRAALVAQDGDQIDGGHLGADELLRRGERAKLVGRIHGGHVEVERQQAAILVALVVGVYGFRRDLRVRELLVDLDVFVPGFDAAVARRVLGEVLMLADADGLRDAIFGDGEVFGGESGNGLAVFVFDDDGFDNQLHFHGERVALRCIGRLVLANLLRARERADQR